MAEPHYLIGPPKGAGPGARADGAGPAQTVQILIGNNAAVGTGVREPERASDLRLPSGPRSGARVPHLASTLTTHRPFSLSSSDPNQNQLPPTTTPVRPRVTGRPGPGDPDCAWWKG